MTAQYHLFEVAWNVGDQPSKAARSRVDRFGDRYVLVGPATSPGLFEPEDGFEGFEEGCRDAGVPVKAGRWRIPGRPRALLVDFANLRDRKDAILARLWRAHRIDSLFAGRDYVQAILFGHAAGIALAHWWREAATRHPGGAVVEVHGWSSGVSLLTMKELCPDVGTIFVVRETVLGRSPAARGNPIDADLPEPSLDAFAPEPLGFQSEHTVEAACAGAADLLAVTSEPAAEDVRRSLGRRADVVLPYGVDASALQALGSPDGRLASRTAVSRAAAAALGWSVDGAAHVAAVSPGSSDDEGVDLFLDALAVLDRRLGPPIVAWVFAPAPSSALKRDVADRLKGGTAARPEGSGVSTHELLDAGGDAVERRCAALGLRNAVGHRVQVLRVPQVPTAGDGFFGTSREAVLAGMDLSCHLSASEPSERGPLESLALGVPAVVTDASGFGRFALSAHLAAFDGVIVLRGAGVSREDACIETAGILSRFISDSSDPDAMALRCRTTARDESWERTLPRHEDAWREALVRARARTEAAARAPEHPHPAALSGLSRLAENLWWTWDSEAQSVFEDLSPRAWRAARRSPVRMLHSVAAGGLPAAAHDPAFLSRISRVVARFDAYMGDRPTAVPRTDLVAYLSAEFGIHESLPIYSGGLGILAGDHLKSASDLSLPLVGVGLLYRRGRVRQRVSPSGEQRLVAASTDPRDLPLHEVTDASGHSVRVEVPMAGGSVVARAWRVAVGRVDLYLLDTDVPENGPEDRTITHILYPSEPEARIRQEVVLGRGGIRLLRRLGLQPARVHLNEGHAAFAVLERVAELVHGGATFAAARTAVRAATAFTTHTPIPAGHDRFPEGLASAHLADVPAALGTTMNDLLALARDPADGRFNMTRLAIAFSDHVNGVSKLHAEVSRRLLRDAWPGRGEKDVPVTAVTNGVHLSTWTHPAIARWLGVEGRAITGDDFAKGAPKADPAGLWAARGTMRRHLLERVRAGLERAFVVRRLSTEIFDRMLQGLREEALLVGFARRFAAYKRAGLLLKDVSRLERLVSRADRPVRVFFAGKAHPDDRQGRGILRRVVEATRGGALEGKVFFLEDYGIALARTLVRGVDVWLNNPLRGLEASGTSGMKVAANGGLNVSVPDGWWPEAFDGENGWSVGAPAALDGGAGQDESDAASLYDIFESQVVPLFFDRGPDGVPSKWLARVVRSLSTIPPFFNTDRMVREYAATAYSLRSL